MALGGCQSQEPAAEPESKQAEQNTKVSINVVEEEDIPSENVTASTTEGATTSVVAITTEGGETE